MSDELQLFSDRLMSKRVKDLDFLRVPCGSRHSKSLYLHNDSPDWKIKNIKCKVRDDDVTVKYPETLRPEQTAKVDISWTPNIDRRSPLDEQELFTGELHIGE